LGDTQQALATRLDLSVRAVANYEKGRRPTLAVLFTLTMIASSTNNSDLADVFKDVYAEQVRGVEKPITDKERALVRVVLALERNREVVPDWEDLGLALVKALGRLADIAEKKPLNTNAEELKDILDIARDFITPRAELRLERLTRQRMKVTGQTSPQAYLAVVMENPGLFREFLHDSGLSPDQIAILPKGSVNSILKGEK
jgi:transcriptional regulator with XRE-family HTH domain